MISVKIDEDSYIEIPLRDPLERDWDEGEIMELWESRNFKFKLIKAALKGEKLVSAIPVESFDHWPTMASAPSIRDKVFELQEEMEKFPIPDLANIDENQYYQLQLPVTYHHGGGVFTGELFIPKGSIVVGKIHKFENLNVMTKGEMSVLVGNDIKRVKAPYVIVSQPGTKRVAYAHEDTIWMTFHATDKIDPDDVEKLFIAQTEQGYLDHIDQLELKLCG